MGGARIMFSLILVGGAVLVLVATVALVIVLLTRKSDEEEGGTGAGSSAFRQAAQQDGGVRITSYSTREWQEYFAESYSLYMTNPAVLQQLRPNVYAFFVANHPR